MSAQGDDIRWNWAGNYQFRSLKLFEPATVDEVRAIVSRARALTVLGTGHSFNGIADNRFEQISLRHLTNISLDREASTVTLGAGVTYTQLAQYLNGHGYALHNLASLPHINVVGACATATHGSGNTNRNLSSAVHALELLTSTGDVVHLSRTDGGQRFLCAVVGLGGFGVVTSATVDIEPSYNVSQTVYENLPLDGLMETVDPVFDSGYSVSVFLTWRKPVAEQVWVKRREHQIPSGTTKEDFFGATPAVGNLHPIPGHPAQSCTQQLGEAGPWHERLPHFRPDHTPSSGNELQSEYYVARASAAPAIAAIRNLGDQISPYLRVSELRVIRGDSFPMSPCYRRDSLAIHFTWAPDEAGVRKVLPLIEKQLAPFEPRPHWGKVFTMPLDRVRSRYDRFDEWARIRQELDPKGTFVNDFLAQLLEK